MVHKTLPEHEHAKMFAPIFIGVAVALAIFGSMPVFVNSGISISNAKSEITYTDCVQMRNSIELRRYPPTCISPDGRRFEKPLPKIVLPPPVR